MRKKQDIWSLKFRKKKYHEHKMNSDISHRGILWEFTFESWWRKWEESGHWAERGVKSGQYCMARYGDIGPYSYKNTKIITNIENKQEALWNNKNGLGYKHNNIAKLKMSIAKIGNTNSLGYKHPPEFGEKVSKSLIGNQRAKGGKGNYHPRTAETKEKCRIGALKAAERRREKREKEYWREIQKLIPDTKLLYLIMTRFFVSPNTHAPD